MKNLKKSTKTRLKRKKLVKLNILKRKADKIFSQWIRQRDQFCFTCNSTQNLQCGHFISRNYLFYRYDEINCHAQCVRCNVFLNGNMRIYTYNMLETYGGAKIKEMEQQKFRKVLNPRLFYESVIQKYGDKQNN